jgi:hypothetical protein
MTELPGANKTQPPKPRRFHRMMAAVLSERAKTIYIRFYTVVLFAFGGLLTFYPHIFELINLKKEESHLLLLVTLLVPYIYLIFEMVVSRLEESDKEFDKVVLRLEQAGNPDNTTRQSWVFEARRSQIEQRRLERKMVVDAFKRSVVDLNDLGRFGTQAVVDWISSTKESAIEVLILAYSSETLFDGLIDVAKRIDKNIKSGMPPPASITFKLLSRNLKAEDWFIPCLATREADVEYRRGLNIRFGQQLNRWYTEFYPAFSFLPREKLALEIKWYDFEPLFKAVIVNRKIGIVGVYDMHPIEREQGWDYHGKGVGVYEIRIDSPDQQSKLALQDFVQLFDEIWARHSSVADTR